MCYSCVQRGMLAQLATRLRERQMGGAGGAGAGQGEGETIVIDDNCEVGLHQNDLLLSSFYVRRIVDCVADHVDIYKNSSR